MVLDSSAVAASSSLLDESSVIARAFWLFRSNSKEKDDVGYGFLNSQWQWKWRASVSASEEEDDDGSLNSNKRERYKGILEVDGVQN